MGHSDLEPSVWQGIPALIKGCFFEDGPIGPPHLFGIPLFGITLPLNFEYPLLAGRLRRQEKA